MTTIPGTPNTLAALVSAKATAKDELRRMRRINHAFKAGRREFVQCGFSSADYQKFADVIEHNLDYGPVPFSPRLLLAKIEQINRIDKLEAQIFANEWPGILRDILSHFDGEHWPLYDDGYRYYVNLKTLDDTEKISALFLKHNPRAYWSGGTGFFDIDHFLCDITDGRVSFDEFFSAFPENVTPVYSALLANPA